MSGPDSGDVSSGATKTRPEKESNGDERDSSNARRKLDIADEIMQRISNATRGGFTKFDLLEMKSHYFNDDAIKSRKQKINTSGVRRKDNIRSTFTKYQCRRCKNREQGKFLRDMRQGNVTCLSCGLVAEESIAFEGDWTREFDDHKEKGKGPMRQHVTKGKFSHLMSRKGDANAGDSIEGDKSGLTGIRKRIDQGHRIDGQQFGTRQSYKDERKLYAFRVINDAVNSFSLGQSEVEKMKNIACECFADIRDAKEQVQREDSVIGACLLYAHEIIMKTEAQSDAQYVVKRPTCRGWWEWESVADAERQETTVHSPQDSKLHLAPPAIPKMEEDASASSGSDPRTRRLLLSAWKELKVDVDVNTLEDAFETCHVAVPSAESSKTDEKASSVKILIQGVPYNVNMSSVVRACVPVCDSKVPTSMQDMVTKTFRLLPSNEGDSSARHFRVCLDKFVLSKRWKKELVTAYTYFCKLTLSYQYNYEESSGRKLKKKLTMSKCSSHVDARCLLSDGSSTCAAIWNRRFLFELDASWTLTKLSAEIFKKKKPTERRKKRVKHNDKLFCVLADTIEFDLEQCTIRPGSFNVVTPQNSSVSFGRLVLKDWQSEIRRTPGCGMEIMSRRNHKPRCKSWKLFKNGSRILPKAECGALSRGAAKPGDDENEDNGATKMDTDQ